MAASKAEFDAALTEARATADATVVKVKSELADTRGIARHGQGRVSKVGKRGRRQDCLRRRGARAKVRRRDDPRGASEVRAAEAEAALADMNERVEELEFLLAMADDEAAKNRGRAAAARQNLEADAEVHSLRTRLDDVTARLAAAEAAAKGRGRGRPPPPGLAAAEAQAGAVLEAADAAEEAEEAEEADDQARRRAGIRGAARGRGGEKGGGAGGAAREEAERDDRQEGERRRRGRKRRRRTRRRRRKGALAAGSGNDFADEFLDTSVDIVALPALSKMRKQSWWTSSRRGGSTCPGRSPVLRARLREARAAAE